MTRTTTLIALTCFLVVGAAVTSILGRDGLPAAGPETTSATVQDPVANRQNKQDRLALATMAMAAYEPPQTVAALSEPLRQAYASASPADIEMPNMIAAPASVPVEPPKPVEQAPKVPEPAPPAPALAADPGAEDPGAAVPAPD